jgi:hypothetical protein
MSLKRNALYDLGYIGCDLADLKAAIETISATLLDIRFSPFSRNPTWNSNNLVKVFGEQYVHCHSLGNENYKMAGMENVKFVDLDKGMIFLCGLLQKGPVIIMCACKDVNHCHRLLVVQEYEKRTGQASSHLEPSDLKGLAGIRGEEQATLKKE